MNESTLYLMIGTAGLVLLLLGVALIKKRRTDISGLLNVALMLVVFSMFFDNRWVAYPMLGIAVVLTIIDSIIKYKKK